MGGRVDARRGFRNGGWSDGTSALDKALAAKAAADSAELVGHDDEGQTAKRNYIGVPEYRPALRLATEGRAGRFRIRATDRGGRNRKPKVSMNSRRAARAPAISGQSRRGR
jgi:hypothetical protein